MLKNGATKVMAAMMAVWAAWNLGLLAQDIRQAAAEARYLEDAAARIRQEIAAVKDGDILDLARSYGYVSREDILFFDGG